MLLLKSLGGLSVQLDGAPATGAAQQRKHLALLALLAASRGISRDKLVAYLWPESDTEHARNTLKQACHALRRDLHPELFLGTIELRLNPQVITSDIGELEDALDRGNLERAAESYAGPFLDGFHLAGAGDFERWVDETRIELARRVSAALESLASTAASAGDPQAAVRWWRRLASLDPLNARVTCGLMRSLAAAGDRAAAVQAARVHESLLREQLGAEPDPAVVDLSKRLQSAPEPALPPPGRFAPGLVAREESVPAVETAVPRSSRAWRPRTMATALAAAVLATAVLLLRQPLGARSAVATRQPMLVVLPFTNLGAAEDEYFADGITEEITARLSAIGDLAVIASTSAQVYKGARKSIPEIGRELGVAYVLEGSVRWQRQGRAPATVRVTPQLVRTSDGAHLWAEVYDEPLDTIFRVQSNIALKVTQALGIALRESQRRQVEAVPTRNLQAYDYYLRGNEYQHRGGEEHFQRAAIQMYERAVALDSGFALAYAMLSRMHSRMYLFHHDRSAQRLAQARRAVDRSLALDPNLPEAHHSLGGYYWMADMEYDRALREYDIAAAARPHGAEIFSARAVVRQRQGNPREALADHARAQQLDPASPGVTEQYGLTYMMLRDFPRAEASFQRARALQPDRVEAYYSSVMVALRWNGSTRRAREVLAEARAAGIADRPSIVLAEAWVELLDRRYQAAIDVLASRYPEVFADQNKIVPRSLLYAQIYGLMQRPDLERTYYDSARTFVLRRLDEHPDDPRLRAALGIAYAGLGRKSEAIEQGRRGVELLPVSREAFRGYRLEWDLAQIYAMVGEHDLAVQRLEYLLSIPGWLTPAWLRIDPAWDPLRGHPRFQRLVSRGM